jgi:hypothetical protein
MSAKDFLNLANPSSRTMALGSTQPLINEDHESSGAKGRLTRKGDILTAICEPIV